MDFTSRGFSWAGNIYHRLEDNIYQKLEELEDNICQKLEDIYMDSDIVQMPCKYVEGVSKKIKKMLDDSVIDQLNPSDSCVDKQATNLSLEHSLEDSNDLRGELDEVYLDEFHQNELMNGATLLPGFPSSMDIRDEAIACTGTSEETVSTPGFPAKEHAQQTESNKSEVSMQKPEIGLSFFNMDHTLKELSWARDIYQKLESICTDDDMVQFSSKSVEIVGGNFRKVLDVLGSDWLNPSDGSVDELVSNLKFEPNIDDKESSIDIHESTSNEKLASVDIDQDLRQQNTNEKFPTYVKVESIASFEEDPSMKAFKEYQDSTGVARVGSSDLEGVTSSTKMHAPCTSEEITSLLDSSQKEHMQKTRGPNELEASRQEPETNGCRGEVVCDSSDVKLNKEQIEVLEDVEQEDFLDEMEDQELALISHRAIKKLQYKNTLILVRVLLSKLLSPRNRGATRMGSSSVPRTNLGPKKSSIHELCESEWEVVERSECE